MPRSTSGTKCSFCTNNNTNTEVVPPVLLQELHVYAKTGTTSNCIENKSSEFKMTHQATANRFSLFSRLAPVVSRILR